jgi:hypothetical protein
VPKPVQSWSMWTTDDDNRPKSVRSSTRVFSYTNYRPIFDSTHALTFVSGARATTSVTVSLLAATTAMGQRLALENWSAAVPRRISQLVPAVLRVAHSAVIIQPRLVEDPFVCNAPPTLLLSTTVLLLLTNVFATLGGFAHRLEPPVSPA